MKRYKAYKIMLVLLSVLSLISCQEKKQDDRKILTIHDIKFPMMDEENGEITFPNPYKKNLLDNKIAAKVRIDLIYDSDIYPLPFKERYRKETKNRKITFFQWAVDTYMLSDTAYYDKNENLLKLKQLCFMCSTKRYEYDSLGFKVHENSGGDVFMYITHTYYFDSINSTLFATDCIAYSDRDHPGIPSCIAIYKFDSLGYLIHTYHGTQDDCAKDTFIYNKDKQIDLIISNFYIRKGSDYENYIDLPKKTISKYYYHQQVLDSITTREFYTNNKYFSNRVTYYDSTGLPIKTIKNTNYWDKPKAVKYIYKYW